VILGEATRELHIADVSRWIEGLFSFSPRMRGQLFFRCDNVHAPDTPLTKLTLVEISPAATASGSVVK